MCYQQVAMILRLSLEAVMASKVRSTSSSRRAAVVFVSVLALAMSACSQQDQDNAAGNAANNPTQSSTAPQSGANTTPAKFTAYTGSFPATYDNKQCAVDMINNQPAAAPSPLTTGGAVTFGGWAGNGQGKAANGFEIVLKGTHIYAAPIQTTVARDDVVKALGSDGMANSGFNLAASLSGVVAGNYSVYIADPANSANVCDTSRSVMVR